MNVLKKLMQRLCGYGKHDDREHGELLTAQLRLGPADILESDENGIIPEQDRGKRTARAVLTGMCYSAGSAMRHGSSS
ncbi:phage tail fiber C-terminal domain-containing protein, partial [Escherichia coli]|uniref:phage tail fiber C-terminal domain-containing protein n=1 Tax=Escherichia coli TaxID=562 RepID=UPI001FCF0E11